jgi:hypothetical protein
MNIIKYYFLFRKKKKEEADPNPWSLGSDEFSGSGVSFSQIPANCPVRMGPSYPGLGISTHPLPAPKEKQPGLALHVAQRWLP